MLTFYHYLVVPRTIDMATMLALAFLIKVNQVGGCNVICTPRIGYHGDRMFTLYYHLHGCIFPHQVTDTCMRLFNDTREEDQERMAALVIKKMEAYYPPTEHPSSPTHSVTSGE